MVRVGFLVRVRGGRRQVRPVKERRRAPTVKDLLHGATVALRPVAQVLKQMEEAEAMAGRSTHYGREPAHAAGVG
eukprot:scaffold13782_cov26-Tisochrysis_lutea.AAC.2